MLLELVWISNRLLTDGTRFESLQEHTRIEANFLRRKNTIFSSDYICPSLKEGYMILDYLGELVIRVKMDKLKQIE